MRVIINGHPHQAPGAMSLAQAVALLTSAESGVAAAVNGAVVRRAEWPQAGLAPGDEVEIVRPLQGG